MRKLATAAAVSLALASGGAFGLGLGDIEVQSSLNQAMQAEIPLTSVQPGELNGIIVQLASPEAFVRAGIERPEVLEGLQFGVDVSSGTAMIRVFSSEPISEPFLNFLLEVQWSGGTMVREYTVLLDPPVLMSPSASTRNSAADQPARSEAGDSLIVPTPIQRDADAGFAVDLGELEDAAPDDVLSLDEALAESTPGATQGGSEGELITLDSLSSDEVLSGDVAGSGNNGASAQADSGDGEVISLSDLEAPNTDAVTQREADAAAQLEGFEVEIAGSDDEMTDDGSTIVSLDDLGAPEQSSGDVQEIEVGPGDTLFEIASDNSPADVSVEQMMMALLAANESSFINRNINLVKAGSILRVPDRGEANRLDQTQALAAVSEQNELWQDYRDSLRANSSTQIAQNLTGEGDQEQGSDGNGNSEAIESAALDANATIEGLSEEAQAILDQARDEVYNREELSIVADENFGNTNASATTDEVDNNDATSVGEINRRLQLAREELAATRLRTTDLSDQAGELEDTSENLDAMVSLRQNEIARLESQLEQARLAAEGEADGGADSDAADTQAAVDTELADASDAISDLGDAVENATDNAADAAENGAEAVTDAAEQTQEELLEEGNEAAQTIADAADSTADSATDAAADAADAAADSGENALTEAGETLGEVEAYSEDDTQSDAEIEQAALDAQAAEDADAGGAWYQNILKNPTYLAVGGLGLVGLLGIAGTLLFRRKRHNDEDDSLDGFEEAGFDDVAAGATGAAAVSGDRYDDADATGAFDASGAHDFDERDEAFGKAGFDEQSLDAQSDDPFAEDSDDVINLPGPKAGYDEEPLDKDDTISEADVYIAYGLHGQAEELLTKAIEKKPDNPDYSFKLLQTYHAQGNDEAYHQTAAEFHQRFGGEANPDWNAIATMGSDLTPGHVLYGSGESASLDTGNNLETGDMGDMLDEDDLDSTMSESYEDDPASDNDFFKTAAGTVAGAGAVAGLGSVSRNFGNSDDDDLGNSDDESFLLEESIDPAFAFDESDLEATGDFTEIADEIAAESENALDDSSADHSPLDNGLLDDRSMDSSLDISSLDETSIEESSLDDSGIDFTSIDDVTSAANETLRVDELTVGDNSLDEAMDVSDLDGMNTTVEDLTLDLDQLSGELDLDSSDMMGTDLADLDIPELTAENELLLDSSGVLGDGSDEMETMLDLAKAYIDMGDKDSASSTLSEIVKGGSPEQVTEAETLLTKIS